jgi:hypothetical protein
MNRVTTVHEQRLAALKLLATHAAGLAYVVSFGIVLLGAAVVLPVLGVVELVSWVAGLLR